MPTFTPEQLANTSGWAILVIVLLGIGALILRGDLVPRSVSDAWKARADAGDKVMAELVPMIRDIAKAGTVNAVQVDFLVDFVKESLRDRDREPRHDRDRSA